MTYDVSEVCTHHNPSFCHGIRLAPPAPPKCYFGFASNDLISDIDNDLTDLFLATA
jgi:hypothetical protein